MISLKEASRCSLWLAVILPITLIGCWSYISRKAQVQFEARVGPLPVTVYPVNVVRGNTVEHDEELAQELIRFLRQEKLAKPVPGTAAAEVPVTWRANQAKMAEQSAVAFAAQVEADGIQTGYALLVEILCNADETRVGGVHYYLSDQAGLLADGGLTNSHWEEFKEVRPTDRQGGCEVAKLMLRRRWGRGG